MRSNVLLAGAELRAVAMLENRDYFPAEMIDLRVGERAFAALEREANKQRIFSRRHIFAAEEVDSLNGSDFRDMERTDRIGNFGKRDSIGQQ